MSAEPQTKSALVAHILGLLIPGAGHLYAGHKKTACAIFIVIIGLFAAGIFMKGGILPSSGDFLSLLCAAGRIGAGLPWIIVLLTELRHTDILSPFGEIGACYTTIAGLLNLLVVLRISELFRRQD